MPITTQPSAGKPAGSSGEFNNSLFGCACGSCCKALLCPCLIAKDVANEVGDSGTLWCLGYLAGIFTGYLVSYMMWICALFTVIDLILANVSVRLLPTWRSSSKPRYRRWMLRWLYSFLSVCMLCFDSNGPRSQRVKQRKIVNCSQTPTYNSYSSPTKLTHFSMTASILSRNPLWNCTSLSWNHYWFSKEIVLKCSQQKKNRHFSLSSYRDLYQELKSL